MIKLTRIQGEEVYINENNIQWIECTPDTTITFMNGHRFIVKEKIDHVFKLIEKTFYPGDLNNLNHQEEEFSSRVDVEEAQLVS